MSDRPLDPFGVLKTLSTSSGNLSYWSLPDLEKAGVGAVSRLPISIRVLLESVLRHVDHYVVTEADVRKLAGWNATQPGEEEIPFMPARVVLQDFTGVPAVVDLAALREACKKLGGDPARINPLVPCDLVVDHSVQVDYFGSADALEKNLQIEFERNRERYEFLKWGQKAFKNFRVVPPGTGIVHQVNLEYLAPVVMSENGRVYPDSVVGTDSHTTMINGLGVVGWGVGGIEAEAVMLGQPIYMLIPPVVGFKLTGKLPEGATATDLVLTITQVLRQKGVVGQFVEFFGPGAASLALPDRATIANMAPEYGATMGFFPVDELTLNYLKLTGRSPGQIDLVERYSKAQGLWRDDSGSIVYSRQFELDLGTVEPSLAGPKRPQDRLSLSAMKPVWRKTLTEGFGKKLPGASAAPAASAVAVAEADEAGATVTFNGRTFTLNHGAVVIAAITSCTNTSNPDVLIAAGLLAKKALEKGLQVKPWVKTSLAPGSRVVTDYLEAAGLNTALDAAGFQTVGYGCTTCIGNSGPLPDAISQAVQQHDLVVCSVLSGNRNFEGRVNPQVKANYLASPPLVVAYALAGTTDIDLSSEPLGTGHNGQPVYLKDIWPSAAEVQATVARCVTPQQFAARYANVAEGPALWRQVRAPEGQMYAWDEKSTYIQHPPFFQNLSREVGKIAAIRKARVLCLLGDSVTTDHISPAGSIKKDSPAGKYLMACGVQPADFNSYGARRGNDRVMTRGTFANIRIRNLLVPGSEGGVSRHLPTGEVASIFDVAEKYSRENTPLLVLAGKDYGMGSSRDWAAKGTYLLGIRAVIAESFERIHRSNLVGMGVLPLQFKPGQNPASLGLSGQEIFEIEIDDAIKPRQEVTVTAVNPAGGARKTFVTDCRIDTPVEVDYYRNGGILQTVLRKIAME